MNDTPNNSTEHPILRIAHVSDPHVWRLSKAPWNWLGKRFLGQLNLALIRKHELPPDIFEQTLQQIADAAVDHLVVTGDFTQTSLPAEFRAAAALLEPFAGKVTTIPGNHDRYTQLSRARRLFEKHLGHTLPEPFPGVKPTARGRKAWPRWRDLPGDVRLIAVDVGKPSMMSRGKMDAPQARRLETLLADAAYTGKRVMVMCHYPFMDAAGKPLRYNRALGGAPRLKALLKAYAPIVMLHGHVHRPWIAEVPDAPGVLCVNPGSSGVIRLLQPFGLGWFELCVGEKTLSVVGHRRDMSGAWQSQTLLSGFPFGAVGTGKPDDAAIAIRPAASVAPEKTQGE